MGKKVWLLFFIFLTMAAVAASRKPAHRSSSVHMPGAAFAAMQTINVPIEFGSSG